MKGFTMSLSHASNCNDFNVRVRELFLPSSSPFCCCCCDFHDVSGFVWRSLDTLTLLWKRDRSPSPHWVLTPDPRLVRTDSWSTSPGRRAALACLAAVWASSRRPRQSVRSNCWIARSRVGSPHTSYLKSTSNLPRGNRYLFVFIFDFTTGSACLVFEHMKRQLHLFFLCTERNH